MPPTPVKVKLPTAAQIKKEGSTSRSRKRLEENQKLNRAREDEQLKITHFSKDSQQAETVVVPLSPSKNRVIHLTDLPSSSSTRDNHHNNDDDVMLSATIEELVTPAPDEEQPARKVRYQGMSKIMAALRDRLPQIQRAYINEHHHLDDFEQLLQFSLFPATVDRIETVVSFQLLDDFYLHTLTSKKAAFDYFDALQRKTNPVLPHQAQVFLRVARIHRHLASKRRAGQSHGIDHHVPHRPAKRTSVYCPACPEPNFNVDVKEISDTPEEKKHVYTIFVAVDGCHSAQQLKKREDPDDVALNEGSAYFGSRHNFRQYIKENTGDKDPLTCSRLKAARMQNILKFKNTVITGIVSAICTRHGLFLPNGIVDMPKGEMFCLGDWAVYHGLLGRQDLAHVHLSYDLWCLYKVRFPERLQRWPAHFSDPKLVELLSAARGCIPQLHIEGHGVSCKACYHYDYTRHVGCTNGKMVETPWSPEKLTRGSTRQMNDGHRHDTLDDFHGFWNFCKVQKLGKTLMCRWAEARAAIDEHQPRFKEFSKLFESKELDKWQALYARPLPDKRDKNIVDLFSARVGQDIPSFRSSIDVQLAAENLRVQEQSGVDGVTLLIAEGISLDMLRCKLLYFARKNVSSAKKQQLLNARRKYMVQVSTFTESLCGFFPLVVPLIASEKTSGTVQLSEVAEVGQSPLFLPSHFSIEKRSSSKMERAAETERALREGQANDLLEEVQRRILTRNHISAVKKVEATGQQHHTRSLALLKTQMDGAKAAMRLYNHNRSALLSLGMDQANPRYQQLEENQLWVLNYSRQRNLGERRADPWYWNASARARTSEDDETSWLLEMNRVKWFRDRALLD
ncbi:hypothetical protein VNI00_018800 [Paramarasmius palmivorus]|uniref:CxC2-like cysteine cluster KDZ transposase-associated domain-containing protein n=1 Tax=Paramarasmius palmivorus TaxID=297713 RepID=A0AAW0AUB7_9AGAR